MFNPERFLSAQSISYAPALQEIKVGRKVSHWMWFIFPQHVALGKSQTSRLYGLAALSEAQAFLEHPTLGQRLIEISEALLSIEGKTAYNIFGSPDDLKLKSSMTLFSQVPNADGVFIAVLQKYFAGQKDEKTLQLL